MKQTFNNWKSINEGMKIGERSEEVRTLQSDLIDMGYSLPSGADGKYGQETKMAVKALQNYIIKQGQPLPKWGADGMWGDESIAAFAKVKRPNGRKIETSHRAPSSTKSTNPVIDKVEKVAVTNGKISHNYSGEAAENINKIIAAGKKHGITNPNTIVGILSIVGKESGFVPKSETSYAGTSNKRIRSIFGSRVSTDKYSDSELNKIKANPDTFWEAVYGYKTNMGIKNLGNDKPGDGGTYRGRGYNQLTGKSNYKRTGEDIGQDLVKNPDLVNNVDIAAEVLFSYLKRVITPKRIKGGLDGFTSVDDAVKNVARANAGWGNSYDSTNVKHAIANSQAVQSNFNIA
jgi:predicted chitinase